MKMPGTNHQGGVAVGVLRNVDVWEAELIISLRLWCSGLSGRADVYEAFSSRFSSERAAQEFEAFERLLNSIPIYAQRLYCSMMWNVHVLAQMSRFLYTWLLPLVRGIFARPL